MAKTSHHEEHPLPQGAISIALHVLKHPSTVPTITQLAALVVLCWMVWHGVTHTLPQIQDGFHEELARERQIYREEMGLIRRDFYRGISANEAVIKRLDAISDSNQKTILENQKTIINILEELKRLRRIEEHQGREMLPMPKEIRS